jgi:putative aldouronate transport system permease protein
MLGIVIAFKYFRAVDIILGRKWVGFQNFRFLFASRNAWRITSNTLVVNG